MTATERIAIIGAGPIGLEAAARAVDDGFDVAVYEAGDVGEHIRQWDHVRFFSPWELNRSPWGMRRLRRAGAALSGADEYPTGAEYLRQYLEPLAGTLCGDIQFHRQTNVVAVSRREALKSEFIGDDQRARSPFLLRIEGCDGSRFDTADIVIDATGVLSQPNPLGPGGLPAIGEKDLETYIDRRIPNVDDDRADYAGRHIVIVGHGHSALTSLKSLHALRDEAPQTEITWAFRAQPSPRTEIDDDPLQQRAVLDQFGNAASRGEIDGIEPLCEAQIRQLEATDDAISVTFDRGGETHEISVDRIVANVGYRPNTSLFRELQVHLCYATEGPMNLAATLLDNDDADCLNQTSGGIDTLQSPEPDFFVLGAKSYGRNSNFLLTIGFDQIDAIFEEL